VLIWPENASALEAKTLERFSRSATREYPIMEAFEASLSLDPWHLRGLRRELAAWLERASVADEICEAIILATHEAAANAIEHADPGTEVTVKGVRADNKLMVMVTNSGEWKVAQAAAEGTHVGGRRPGQIATHCRKDAQRPFRNAGDSRLRKVVGLIVPPTPLVRQAEPRSIEVNWRVRRGT